MEVQGIIAEMPGVRPGPGCVLVSAGAPDDAWLRRDALAGTPGVARAMAESLVRAAMVAAGASSGALFERPAASVEGELRLLWAEGIDDAVLRAARLALPADGLLVFDDCGVWGLFLGGAYRPSKMAVARAALAVLAAASSAPAADAKHHLATREGVGLVGLLEASDWNVARVARTLGVTRVTVYSRMRRLGIARQRLRLSGRRGRGLAGPVSARAAAPTLPVRSEAERVADLLGLVLEYPPNEAECAARGADELAAAAAWAGAVHVAASDNDDVVVPAFPEWLRGWASPGEARQGGGSES